jgi:hypothetical protein
MEYLSNSLPELVAVTTQILPPKDVRLDRLQQLLEKVEKQGSLDPCDRGAVIAAVAAAKKAALQAQTRVRAFRNVLLGAALLASLIAVILAIVGLFYPGTIPLCQINYGPGAGPGGSASGGIAAEPTTTCPASGDHAQPADTLIVMFAGIMGATVAVVFALRKVRGTADPYSVPFAAAILKLPTGALTAALGLLLIRGGFVPGFTGLDSSAQIIAWAIVFGFSQELFTALVDKQAQAVLAASPSVDTEISSRGGSTNSTVRQRGSETLSNDDDARPVRSGRGIDTAIRRRP